MAFAPAIPDIEDGFKAAVRIGGALVGIPLLLKGWDGSAGSLQPVLSAVGAAMITPAPVYGILHNVQDSYVRLSDKFSHVSTKRLTALSGAVAFGLMAATHSIHETNQSELHTARVEACGGAHAGKISFRYKGADSFVDCATMMTPTQQP